MKTILVRHLKAAFTLLELMLVIAIITLLIGLLFAGIQSAMKSRRIAQAMTQIKSIEMASTAYWSTYSVWPNSIGVSTSPHATFSTTGSLFVNCMIGNHATLNPRMIRFLDIPSSALGGAGATLMMIDPYGRSGSITIGTPYNILFDTNGDGTISVGDIGAVSGIGTITNRGVVIWSNGPNRTNNFGTLDDHRSW
jgi:prepilin-type N-terminal cleavage/methylation domain-containing protein